MTTQDPLFFAEEFAARRRRYIPVPVDIGRISRLNQYKNYNFPFITSESLKGKLEDYDLLFKGATDTRFPDVTNYRPTTRFEAMSYEVYRVEAHPSGTGDDSRLERVRKLFVNSLLDGQEVDLSRLRTTPHIPSKGDFSVEAPRGGPAPFVSSRTFSTQLTGRTTPFIAQNYPHHIKLALDKLIVDCTRPGQVITLLDLQLIVSMASILKQKLIDFADNAKRLNDPVENLLRVNINRLDSAISGLQLELTSRGGNELLKIIANSFANRIEDSVLRQYQAARADANAQVVNVGLAVDGMRGVQAMYNPGRPAYLTGIFLPAPEDLVDGITGNLKDVGQGTIINNIDLSTLNLSLMNMFNTNAAIETSLITLPPPLVLTGKPHGYLTPEFTAYLTQVAHGPVPPSSSRCLEVLFKDQPMDRSPPIAVDMAVFMRSISPVLGRAKAEFSSHLNLGDTSGLSASFDCPDDDYLKKMQLKPVGPLVNRIGAPTIEEAYSLLQAITGTPLERYLKFVRFVYFFFDHIPEVQPVVSALMAPLLGMYAGIIARGVYDVQFNSPLSLLQDFNTPEKLQRVTTFLLASEAFNDRSTREEAARAVLRMYRHFVRPRATIRALLRGNPRDVVEVGHVDIPPGKTEDINLNFRGDFLAIPIEEKRKDVKRAREIYNSSSIVEFNLPSIGSAHMILPAILGFAESNIMSQVYNISARWFPSMKEQQRAISEINAADYRTVSRGRYGYTAAGTASLVIPPKTENYVKIVPRPGPPVYIDVYVVPPPNDLMEHYNDRVLPSTWEQLLYPAYVSHAILEPDRLRDVAKTLVRPCLQEATQATVFASDLELKGGYVEVQGIDIETRPEVFSAVFEFPADVVSVTLPTAMGPGPRPLYDTAKNFFPGIYADSAGRYSILRRGTSRDRTTAHGTIVHQMVNALNVSDLVPGIRAWSTESLNLDSNPLTVVPILKGRTRYIWSSLPGATEPSAFAPTITAGTPPAMTFDTTLGDTLFLPALDIEFFLSSLFDWKLQLFYLRILRNFLQDRSYLKPMLDKINATWDTLDANVKRSLQDGVIDEAVARAYIKSNSITSLASTAIPYSGFRNLVFSITGPTSSANLSELLKTTEVIKASDLASDTKKFYITQAPTPPRGPLNYDLDIDSYLGLLKARAGDITSVEEKPTDAKERIARENLEEKEKRLAELKTKSAERLKDPYSILVDEIITRSIFKVGS